jgi:serine protease Do
MKCCKTLVIAIYFGLVPATPVHSQQVQPAELLRQFNGSLEALAAKVSPSVVQIQVTGVGRSAGVVVQQPSMGSGVIIDPDGYIMTNAHVVDGARRIRVVLPIPSVDSPFDVAAAESQPILEARVTGVSKELDLALLKVEAADLPALALDDRRSAHPGQLVFAIGSPLGLMNSITMGIVSSVWRQTDADEPAVYIQTDAPINPGNSGGPLVDVDGSVVGLNTFILSNGGGSEGLGFAIPVEIVKIVYEGLRKYGHLQPIDIQAAIQTITPTLAAGLGLAQEWGVIVSDVSLDGPASIAGVKVQDIVFAVDDHPIRGLPGFVTALYLHSPQEMLKLDILRGSEKLSLGVSASQYRYDTAPLADVFEPERRLISRLGIFAVESNLSVSALMPNVRIATGVVVLARTIEWNSVRADLRQGDIIFSINSTPITSVEELRSAATKLKAGDPVVMQIERQGKLHYLAFEME